MSARPRFCVLLGSILIVIAVVWGVVSSGLLYPFPVLDIILGLIVAGMALSMRRH